MHSLAPQAMFIILWTSALSCLCTTHLLCRRMITACSCTPDSIPVKCDTIGLAQQWQCVRSKSRFMLEFIRPLRLYETWRLQDARMFLPGLNTRPLGPPCTCTLEYCARKIKIMVACTCHCSAMNAMRSFMKLREFSTPVPPSRIRMPALQPSPLSACTQQSRLVRIRTSSGGCLWALHKPTG